VFRDDYLMRLIRQLVDFLARISALGNEVSRHFLVPSY